MPWPLLAFYWFGKCWRYYLPILSKRWPGLKVSFKEINQFQALFYGVEAWFFLTFSGALWFANRKYLCSEES